MGHTGLVETSVTELRENLKATLQKVKKGEDITVTERGRPIARITGPVEDDHLQLLIEQGVVSKPMTPKRPHAQHRRRVTPDGAPISELVSAQRK